MDRKVWQKHETDIQNWLGLNGTIASGNKFYDPGDGSTGHNRLMQIPMIADCKATEKKTFSIDSAFLTEWAQRADELGKMPLLPVRFVKPNKVEDYMVLRLEDFQTLLELSKKALTNELR